MSNATLLTIHNAFIMLSLFSASGFIGAYLLRSGVSLPAVLLLYAALYLCRFGMRLAILPVLCIAGAWGSLILGVFVTAFQFLPLAAADHDPRWLIAWLGCVTLGEALYWPTYHASVAVAGKVETRGRQQGLRAALTAAASILGPLIGAFVITRFGPSASFAVGSVIALASILPLLWCREFSAGTAPSLRDSFRNLDRPGMTMFLIDGWMSAGWFAIWPILYFLLLGSRYETFGLANAAAGVVGLALGMVWGRWIDRRRHNGRDLALVCAALTGGILFRAAASRWPLAGALANLTGAALNSFYTPFLMSALYDRAKRTNNALRFHLSLESAWDMGVGAGFVAGAGITWAVPTEISLAVLPSLIGVAAFAVCMRRERRDVARHRAALPSSEGDNSSESWPKAA